MTVSMTGPASNGLVYLTMIGHDAAGHTTMTQASGVLLSDDEVLTAAHVVYNDDGSLRTAGVASVGYNAGSSIANSTVDGAQALTKQDYTTVSGIGSDFAVVHLKTPVTNGTIFSLGSDLTDGTFSVSGYPVGTAGVLDTKTEQLTVATGSHIYTGETLHDGTGNPEGSSGGSVYQIINGQPTVFGVISADLSSNTTQGFFKELTAADVSQIRAWVNSADSGTKQTTGAGTTSSGSSTGATSVNSSPAITGFSQNAASALMNDAASITGHQNVVMSDVAAAITQVCNEGSTAAHATQDAADYINGNSLFAKRAVAYLAGFLSGMTGSWSSDIATTANTMIDGAVDGAATRRAAAAGRSEALTIGYSNTSATIDPASAALANVISASGDPASDTASPLTMHYGQQPFHILATRDHH